MSDEPIEPVNFIAGVKVIDIGDLRIARGLTRRSPSTCAHKSMVYDENERRIWCRDCEKDVDTFAAFVGLCAQWNRMVNTLITRERLVSEAEQMPLFHEHLKKWIRIGAVKPRHPAALIATKLFCRKMSSAGLVLPAWSLLGKNVRQKRVAK